MTDNNAPKAATPNLAVGPQYDTTHVYVEPEDFEKFVASFVATFGGMATPMSLTQITPAPSQTMFQLVMTPVGTLSVLGFKTPIPFPFGQERTGYLVTDMETAVQAALAHGADVVVSPFDDPIGSDAITRWPGGVNMQFYTHTTPPAYKVLQTVPENRIYMSPYRVDAFIKSFVGFSRGQITYDVADAAGVGIGRPADTYRRVGIDSNFGKIVLLVTDGHLPYPYGREFTGYEVANLSETLTKAKAAGAKVVDGPYADDKRTAAMVNFPGGHIAEVHSLR